ncbi:MAG TPA: DUF6491 family protein [Allosphingosinicella sp.]|nr:DUF6491 family protein [Allosphingosinicella sp.]
MKYWILLASACLVAGCATDEPVETAADDEARLAAQLAGYEPAGPPVSCVNLRDLDGNRSAGETAIVFDGRGGRKWVNRPPAGCPSLEFGRALRTRTSGSQLCRNDIATVFDPVSRIEYGGCGLGDFEPYRRVRG